MKFKVGDIVVANKKNNYHSIFKDEKLIVTILQMSAGGEICYLKWTNEPPLEWKIRFLTKRLENVPFYTYRFDLYKSQDSNIKCRKN
jgi:poly(A) polymerase Pap1